MHQMQINAAIGASLPNALGRAFAKIFIRAIDFFGAANATEQQKIRMNDTIDIEQSETERSSHVQSFAAKTTSLKINPRRIDCRS